MGFLTGLFGRERRTTAQDLLNAWLAGESWESAGTATGLAVTPESSLNYTAVLACVRVLCEGVASLPCKVYERFEAEGREAKRPAPDHPVYALVHSRPNPVQTAFELYEMGMAHCLLWGNFYAEIEWDSAGQAVALWPLPAWRVTPTWNREGKLYKLELSGGQTKTLPDYQVLHVPSFGYDGTEGKSMIRLAREAVGLGMATEAFGSAFFGNGARPGAVLEHPGKLSPEAHERLKKSWESRHQGLANAQRIAILEEGMKIETIGVPPEDAQFLETRRFQRQEIAAIFRVPPHMIGDLERATFSNIEQQSTDFYTNTLQPWLRRWEQRLLRSLFVGDEQDVYFPEFLVDALLRGDTAARYSAYAVGRNGGWLSANDIRARENMNPIEGGDVYLTPMNMSEVGEEPEEEPEAEEPAEEEEGERGTPEGSHKGLPLPGGGDVWRDISREMRSAESRRRLAQAYRPALSHVAQRIVNREINDVRQAAQRFLAKGDLEGFQKWLRAFDAEHSQFVADYLRAPLWAYLRLVVAEIERELDRAVDDKELAEFGGEYVPARGNAWMADLMRGIRKATRRPEDVEASAWDAAESVDDWATRRQEIQAEAFARDETTRGGNAMALAVYSLAGVGRKIWKSYGSTTCPYCRQLDGKTVKIKDWFLPTGQGLVDDAGQVFQSLSDVGHPPLHDGCDCMVVAGV